MPLTLDIPEDIARSAEELARASGSSPEAVLLEALKAHFPPVPAPLRVELDAWELASDRDMSALDVREGPG